MVSPILSDTVVDPAKEIKELSKSQDVSQSDLIGAVERHFRELLSPQDAFLQIPPLSVSHPPPVHRQRGLVRFMGMVQDTSASPEVYLSVLEDGSCGGWGIYEHSIQAQATNDSEPPAIDYSKLKERDSVWAVTIPGQSNWIEERFNGPEFPSPSTSRLYTCPKKYKCANDDADAFGLYLKLYDNRNLKPGEVKVFVGILDEQIEDQEEENHDKDSPSVPTLHVIFTMDTTPVGSFGLQDLRAALPDDRVATREELINWIADEGLGGDTTLATWLLLLSIGKVQSRSPPIFPPTLTVSSFPDAPSGASSTPTIVHVLKMLLPGVASVPLTLDNLNGKLFVPTSLEEDLHSGVLQHPNNTVMVVTENGMTEGKVTEKGLKNLDALQSAMATQTVSYSFPYSSYPFLVDLRFLVLTRGRKSAFLKTDTILPLKNTIPSYGVPNALYKSENEIVAPVSSKLHAFRSYIAACRQIDVTLSQDVGKHIEDEFVRLRRESADKFSSEDLARRMSIAKLLSASLLEGSMTKDTWEAANSLDRDERG